MAEPAAPAASATGSPTPRRPRKAMRIALVALVVLGALLFISQDKATLRIQSPLAVEDPRFPAYLSTHVNAPLTRGNNYLALHNGDQIFPAMLDAIRTARQRLEFESYIFSGSIAET